MFFQLESSKEAKKIQVDELTAAYNTVKEEHTNTQASLTKAEELLQTLVTGLSTSKSIGGGYMGQLADAQRQLTEAQAEEEQGKMKLSMAEKDLKALETRWKNVEREAGEGKKNVENMRRDVEALKTKLDATGWDEEKERNGEIALRTLRGEVRQLTEVGYCYMISFFHLLF